MLKLFDDSPDERARRRERDMLELIEMMHWSWLAEMRWPGAALERHLVDGPTHGFLMDPYQIEERTRRPAVTDVEQIIAVAEEWPELARDLGFDGGVVVGIDIVPATDRDGNRIPDEAW